MSRSTIPARQRAPGQMGNSAQSLGRRGSTINGMTAGQLAVLRGMLEEQRAFRVDQLVQLESPASGGPLSSSYRDVTASLRAGAKAALRDVQLALWRMDEGSYGRCTDCDQPVGPQRLEILPHAALCMGCQRAYAG